MEQERAKKIKTLTQYKEEFANYYFDFKAARRVVAFFERELTHQIGKDAEQPLILEHWQKRILRRFFGWKHRDTGLRKYQTLYLEIPRKNGKSILAAGLGLYLMDADKEPAARVVTFALNEDQAKESVFDVAKGMVELNPKMSQRMTLHKKSIASHASASNFLLLSGNAKGKHGKNLSALIGDEVHEWYDREAMDALRTSMGTREQPVEIYLTTAGFDKNSICWEMHEYAEKVNSGEIEDPTFMGVIYAAQEPEDNPNPLWWTDEKVWFQANPNLGVSVRLEYLRKECKKAQQIPSYENVFKRLHLNIWTEQDSRWISLDLWDSCYLDYTEESLLDKDCYVGIDLAATSDIGAVVYLFPPNYDFDEYRVLCKFFLPRDAIKKRKKDRVHYDVWEKAGLIKVNEGNVLDYGFIEQELLDSWQKFNIKKVSMDRWNAIHLATILQNAGLSVEFWLQTMASLNGPTKELETLLLNKGIAHDGNKVLRWMAGNVAIIQDSKGNLMPDKGKSSEKIDGIAALINALGRAILEKGSSIYDTDGIRTT